MRLVIAPLAAAFLMAAVPPGHTFANSVPPQVPDTVLVPAKPVIDPVPTGQAVFVRAPQPRYPVQSVFSRDDYPAAAVASHAHGTVRFTLTIDPAGRVVGCAIDQSSGSSVLDQATCQIVHRRARFIPAMDSNGNPVTGTITQEVTWRA